MPIRVTPITGQNHFSKSTPKFSNNHQQATSGSYTYQKQDQYKTTDNMDLDQDATHKQHQQSFMKQQQQPEQTSIASTSRSATLVAPFVKSVGMSNSRRKRWKLALQTVISAAISKLGGTPPKGGTDQCVGRRGRQDTKKRTVGQAYNKYVYSSHVYSFFNQSCQCWNARIFPPDMGFSV